MFQISFIFPLLKWSRLSILHVSIILALTSGVDKYTNFPVSLILNVLKHTIFLFENKTFADIKSMVSKEISDVAI